MTKRKTKQQAAFSRKVADGNNPISTYLYNWHKYSSFTGLKRGNGKIMENVIVKE